ncbi:MAG: hypothetical protein HY300_17195 [Verrucomicrobia bacterium]|nr:hypothetical protein [Verrucomicrobiota bacterium]
MSENSEQEKSSRTSLCLAFGMAAAMFLYVFSIGPVAAMAEKLRPFGICSAPAVSDFYAPILLLVKIWRPAAGFYNLYLEFWFRLVGA